MRKMVGKLAASRLAKRLVAVATSKVMRKLIQAVSAVVSMGATLSIFAGLLMLGWNFVVVAALSVATAVSFPIALAGTAVIWATIFLINVIRASLQARMQKINMEKAAAAYAQIAEQMQRVAAEQEQAEEEKEEGPLDKFRIDQ